MFLWQINKQAKIIQVLYYIFNHFTTEYKKVVVIVSGVKNRTRDNGTRSLRI